VVMCEIVPYNLGVRTKLLTDRRRHDTSDAANEVACTRLREQQTTAREAHRTAICIKFLALSMDERSLSFVAKRTKKCVKQDAKRSRIDLTFN
jgi:hypothetical protein